MALVELLLPPQPEHVRTARLIAVAVARRAGLADELVDELRLAVGEAVARAVSLHLQHAPDERVALALDDDVTGLRVTVTDAGPVAGPVDGELFDTGADDAAGADDPASTDVALAVLHGLVDEVEVTARPDGTAGSVVTLTWPLAVRLAGGPPGTAAAEG